jgi:hypothetical protein
MKIRRRCLTVFVAAFVLFAGLAYGQAAFQLQAYKNLKVEILPESVFNARFGNNPEIPRSEEAILALARKLYPSQAFKEEFLSATAEHGDCGEPDVGVLFAALQNPAISDATRMLVDNVIAEAIPPLPKSKISPSGHFKIDYTSTDANPLNNVTDVEIEDLAARLDSYWNTYAKNFKKPKYYMADGKERIDIKVYYISSTFLGQTASVWNHIELNSSSCVKNLCKRRTISAHELFHRVQFAYGFISGTANMNWMSEGTATWSQKYTNENYRDYMEWMNIGLGKPNVNLIATRSYDACHFWVFLEERSNYTVIKQVWANYQTNGKNAKKAVNTVTNARLGLTFNQYAQKWSKANALKDVTNASTDGYDYVENAVTKTSCGVTYSPLSRVPATNKSITPTSSFTQTGKVTPYGARYYVYTLGSTLTDLAITFNGTGSFAVSFIGLKNTAWQPTIVDTTANTYNYEKTLTAGQWAKLAVMVMGTATGGNYTLTVGNDDCITGTWVDQFNHSWFLEQSGTTITGSHNTGSVTCGTVPVTGTYTAPNITLYLNTVPFSCCTLTYEGTVTACDSISGAYTRTGGPPGCTGSKSLSMSRWPPKTNNMGKDTRGIAAEPMMEEGPDAVCRNCN